MQGKTSGPWRAGALVCFCAGALLAGSLPAAEPPARGAQEAIRLQQLAKRRFQELIRIMTDTSRRLEATDRKTAEAIAAAAQKAESALIADEMDKVVELLRDGLVIPADSTQAVVVQRLREVLKALRGEEGMEWRIFLLEELKQQMIDLGLLVERQRVLERRSRMLGFGERARAEIAALRQRADALVREQDGVLQRTRRLAPSPVSTELGGFRHGIAGMVQRFEVAREGLFNPVPSVDELSRNVVAVRRFHAQAASVRTGLRTLLNRDDVRKALAAAAEAGATNAPPAAEDLLRSVANAADELQRSAAAMSTNDVADGLLALSQAKSLLLDACGSLDEMAESFSDVKPAVRIVTEQKPIDDAVSQLQPVLRNYFVVGETVMDDTPDGDYRVEGNRDRLAPRTTSWERQVPLLVTLNPLGAATRQEQSLEKLKDWVLRLDQASEEIDRLKDDPRYPVQKSDQEGIERDLRSMLAANKSRAETVGDDTEMTQIFELLDTAMANAADYSRKASEHLGGERPREANTNQNDVIHLLTTVMNRVGPELRMDKNKYAMNEQAQARIQRMLMKQKMCLGETRAVWARRGADGAYSRPDRLRIEEIAREEKGIQDDADFVWEIVNTAHNRGYNTFPAEARLVMELARVEIQAAEKRLRELDPGEETQRIEESIIERLKLVDKMASLENPTGAKEMDRRFTYDSFLSRGPINTLQRVPILMMLIGIQEDIQTRTARIAAARRAGRADPALDAEAEQLRQLQENVLAQLAQYARDDAQAWMQADRMATQYGGSTGGSKQFFLGKGGR